MWTSGPREIFARRNYKICDQIKLFGDLSRAVFGEMDFGCGSKKIVKKKWIHEYMKEKSKVQTSCLFKNNHFSQYPGRIQGSKRLVDGIRCGLFFLCCSPFYVVHLFILREASFPMERTKLLGVISFQPESCVINLLHTFFTPANFLRKYA